MLELESDENKWKRGRDLKRLETSCTVILLPRYSVTSKKLPNVYKSCPKMILLEKLKILTPLTKMCLRM